MKRAVRLLPLLLVTACGSKQPPPATPEPEKTEARHEAPMPVVQQELGSIDERGVEMTFQNLQGALEKCHTEGRDRVELISGDVKVFLRVGQDGKAKYAYFESSNLGDRATEKCILGVLSGASWPKPIGGEAEVRHQFGWEAGQERPPTSWGPEKVTTAIEADHDAKKAIAACKPSGELTLTGYVVRHEKDDDEEKAAPPPPPSKPSKKGGGTKPAPAKRAAPPPKPEKDKEHGVFRALGGSASSKQAAESIDCVIDALGKVHLPSPGSYAAKVSFKL